MEEDKKIVLQEAVTMSAWTHNTNVNVLGYSPLQLMTKKSIVFPSLTTGNTTTDSLYDNEAVRKIMERHHKIMRKFREVEFSRKLNRAKETRLKRYEDEVIKEGDLVLYQHQDKKAWLGPVQVFSIQRNSVFLFANGSMRKIPRCNVQLWSSEGDKHPPDLEKDKKLSSSM